MRCILLFALFRKNAILGYLEICPFYSGNYGRVEVLGLTLAEYHTYRYSLSVAYLNVVSSVHVSTKHMTASKHCWWCAGQRWDTWWNFRNQRWDYPTVPLSMGLSHYCWDCPIIAGTVPLSLGLSHYCWDCPIVAPGTVGQSHQLVGQSQRTNYCPISYSTLRLRYDT
jgi:hypothetical protein